MTLPPVTSPPLEVRGKLYSIPSSNAFIETLARGMLRQAEQSPLSQFSQWRVFLPTRRACIALREALLRLSAPPHGEEAHALLLPRLVPLGATGDGEKTEGETVSALERRLLLTRLVEAWLAAKAKRETKREHAETSIAPSTLVAVRLASALARLQEDFTLEEVDAARILTTELVPDNCAVHWREALDFLRIVLEAWPQVLQERGVTDPVEERLQHLSKLALELGDGGELNEAPVIVAGSTGSVKATARLKRAVLSLSQGQVILAGCPAPLDAANRKAIFEDGAEPTHPLHPFRSLFLSWGIAPKDIEGDTPNNTQTQLANLLQPYPAASPSRNPERDALFVQAFSKRPTPPKHTEQPLGLTLLPCSDSQEEASLIALILREALEIPKGTPKGTPKQRAALITRDRTLARRVRSALQGHWQLNIEDTAGQPLSESPAALLFMLPLQALTPENPWDTAEGLPLDIVALQALFAHASPSAAQVWQHFEASVLRQSQRAEPTRTQRAASDLRSLIELVKESGSSSDNIRDSLRDSLPEKNASLLSEALATLLPLAECLASANDPLNKSSSEPSSDPSTLFPTLLRCHRSCAENFFALCQEETQRVETQRVETQRVETQRVETSTLYDCKGGAELQRFCDTLERHWQEASGSSAHIHIEAQDYRNSLEALLAAESRGGLYASHPRLAILGPLEARLLSFDLLVLGGLTEGSWPAEPDKSPFLPEHLREKVGLKPLEHNIGLSALDFLNFASAPQSVVITHAQRSGGQPRQPSRFVQRLQACGALRSHPREAQLHAWLATLKRGRNTQPHAQNQDQNQSHRQAPAPKVAQSARPLHVNLTKLANLCEDPYSLYARQVLCLKPLEPLLPEGEAALYGSCLHACFEDVLIKLQTTLQEESEKSYDATLQQHIVESQVEVQLARFAPSPFAQAFWREPLLRSTHQLLRRVRALRPQRLWCEVAGKHYIALDGGRNLRLTARADLVIKSRSGEWWIIDHKTGGLPTRKTLQQLEQPQLVLGAWLLQQGAFGTNEGILKPASLPQACYWKFSVKGNSTLALDEKVWAKKNADNPNDTPYETAQAFADACNERYTALLQHFDHENTPYSAHALSPSSAAYDPYRHLARRLAWSGEDNATNASDSQTNSDGNSDG